MCNCINCIKVKLIIKYRATKRLEVKIPKGGTKERESVARGGIRDNLGGRDENNPLETVLIKKRKEKKKTIDLGNELVD